MAVIINELEIVVDPEPAAAKTAAPKVPGKAAQPVKPPLAPHDILTVLDREKRNCLRLMAH
jgi:hypothetical protein